MPSNDETFFKIFRDKHGSIIIGLVLKRLNIILLASDSRLTFKDGSVMLDDDDNEYKFDKIFDGKYFAMAMCGYSGFTLELGRDIIKSTEVHNSDGLRDSIIEKMNTKAINLPEKKRKERASCGVLVAMFDYKGDKPIPRLMGIELEVRKSGLNFRKSNYGRYNFDGDHYDELKKFLRINYRPWLSLKRGIALIRKCINIVKGTSIRSGETDSVGGYMSVWDISPASPQERRDGTLFHFNERQFDQQIVPEEAPTYPPRHPRRVRRKR